VQETVYPFPFRSVMGYVAEKSNIRTLREGDPMFHIVGNVTLTPRAGFEITEHCPNEYVSLVTQAIRNGWLKPIAYVRDDELMWDKIKG